MKLKTLVPKAAESPTPIGDADITHLTQDSRDIRPGTLFFAIEGSSRDGHEFIADVLIKGAAAVVARESHPKLAGLQADGKVIAVTDVRQALGEAASRFYREPSKNLLVCGVTGTNGKTTSTYLLEALLSYSGQRPAVIGTVENRLGDLRIPSTHTTPDALGLQKLLREFADHGATAIAMEVSSHALDQKRVAGTKFDAALFTNLTQDHLDYHPSMDEYMAAKARFFFDYPSVRVRAIHADDSRGRRLADECRARGLDVITYGRGADCDVSYAGLALSASGISGALAVHWRGTARTIELRSRLLGGFNAQNLAGVAAVGVGLGLGDETIAAALAGAAQVPGRMQTIPNDRGVTVVVDYAHTPDALEKALSALRELSPSRLLTVFGCGGDRDPTKRPIMGEIAERLSDVVFVTSDNPRTEDPEKIIDMISKGFKEPDRARRVPDRAAAIAQAVGQLRAGDILLIAGKGHEDYQIVGTQKLPFDDREIAAGQLKRANS